jgi:hypothetical protein
MGKQLQMLVEAMEVIYGSDWDLLLEQWDAPEELKALYEAYKAECAKMLLEARTW